MESRKVYGSLDNKGTLRVLASLYEHEVDFEFSPVDIKSGENLTESFLAMSPLGELPVLVDGELTLFKSRCIIRMIGHAYLRMGKEQCFNNDSKSQGLIAAWIDVEAHQFDPPTSKLIEELVEKPKNGIPTNEAVVAEEEAMLAKVLDVYEEKLSKTMFLGGNMFTTADLSHIPNLYLLKDTQVKRLWESRPRVNAWAIKVMGRPGWNKVVEMLGKNPA